MFFLFSLSLLFSDLRPFMLFINIDKTLSFQCMRPKPCSLQCVLTQEKTRNLWNEKVFECAQGSFFSFAVFSPVGPPNRSFKLFSVVFPPHFLNLRKSGLEDFKVVENPTAPNTHVHACNYTHFIWRGSPVFNFVEFTKGHLPLRRARMIHYAMFVPRTGMTVPCVTVWC